VRGGERERHRPAAEQQTNKKPEQTRPATAMATFRGVPRRDVPTKTAGREENTTSHRNKTHDRYAMYRERNRRRR